MTEQLDFETSLERRLRVRAAAGSRPFDASAIARAAIAARPPRRLGLTAWTGRRAWALVLAGLLLALLAGALVAGALLQHREPWLAVARADGIYLAHRDGSLDRRLTDSTSPRLSWSSDGALLLVADVLGNSLRAFRPDGSVVWTTNRSNGGTAWSHHGHRIAWLSGSSAYVIDTDTGQLTQLAGPYASWGRLDWSPDDTHIVANGHDVDDATSPMGLLVVPADGGDPVVLTPDAFRDLSYPAWSPDGRSIAAYHVEAACCPEQGSITVFDAATGQRIDRTAAGGFPVAWSPDGKRLAWTRAITDGTVVVDTLPLSDGGATAVLPGPGPQRLAGWTPDGALLVLMPNASQVWPDLWRVEADGSRPVLLARNVRAAALQPTP